jgi:hypothetical protein
VSHILYIMSMQPTVEGDQFPLHKKIGITNNTTVRASQLATKMPFRMYVEAAWEIPDGRDNPLGNQLRAKFGERVNRSAYGNGLISDRVQISEQELREIFGAPRIATVSTGPQVALVQSPA